MEKIKPKLMDKEGRMATLLKHIVKLKPKMLYQVLLDNEIVAEYDDFAEANEYFEMLLKQKEEAKTKTEQQEQWDNFVANLPRSWRLWEHPDPSNPAKELCYETMPRNFAASITLLKDGRFELYLQWANSTPPETDWLRDEFHHFGSLYEALGFVEDTRRKGQK